MRVLIACEFSGRVRDAFRALGHDAVSCDLLPSATPGPHITGPVEPVLADGWDAIIAFPPCTHLANSGARWFPLKRQAQAQALAFVQAIIEAPTPRLAIENPVGILSTRWRRPDQIVEPWWFGDPFRKRTCLWLRGLPLLVPAPGARAPENDRVTFSSGKSMPAWYNLPPGPERAKIRSTTFPGLARAMAVQWGSA